MALTPSTDVVSIWDLQGSEAEDARIARYESLVGHSVADYLAHEEDGGLVAQTTGGGGGGKNEAVAKPAELPRLDYLIGCQYDAASGRLLLLGGTKSGGAHLFELNAYGMAGAAGRGGPSSGRAPTGDGVRHVHSLAGGHADAVRCFHMSRGASQVLTGGEDGRLCAWGDPSSTAAAAMAGSSSDGAQGIEASGALPLVGGPAKKEKKAKERPRPYDKPK